MSNRHSGERLQHYRKTLGLGQADLATIARTTRQGTISDWERSGKAPLGALRLFADLCHNDREVYAWLRDGGTMPPFLRILPGVPIEAAWQGERRAIAARLRSLADELDPSPREESDDWWRALEASKEAVTVTPPPSAAKGRGRKRA